jgi:putative heme transporter
VAGALSVLIALVVQGPATALGVLILILVVQQVEGNLLQPLVQGRGLGLNAALVILAVVAGSSLAGIAGAFLAVPVAAVLAEILRYLGERIDAHAQEPVDPEPDADAGAEADDAEDPAVAGKSTVPSGGRPSDVTDPGSGSAAPASHPAGAPDTGAGVDTRAARATGAAGAAGAARPGDEDRSVGGG